MRTPTRTTTPWGCWCRCASTWGHRVLLLLRATGVLPLVPVLGGHVCCGRAGVCAAAHAVTRVCRAAVCRAAHELMVLFVSCSLFLLVLPATSLKHTASDTPTCPQRHSNVFRRCQRPVQACGNHFCRVRTQASPGTQETRPDASLSRDILNVVPDRAAHSFGPCCTVQSLGVMQLTLAPARSHGCL